MSANSLLKQFIHSPDAPPIPASIPISLAVQSGNVLYISGTLGVDTSGVRLVHGFAGQLRQALDNIGKVLQAAGASYKNVVKVTVLLADLRNFGELNKIYSEYFPKDYPARICYQPAKLPLDAEVEIEAIAAVGNDAKLNLQSKL